MLQAINLTKSYNGTTALDNVSFISLSLLLQDAFNDLAGTSSRLFESYRKQVIVYSDEWLDYFLPRMFRNETMKQSDFASLPSFTFDYDKAPFAFYSDLIGMVVFTLGGLFVSTLAYRRYAKEVLFS